MVYSAHIINKEEYMAAQKRLSALLSSNMKQEYSEMCGFLKARMSLAILRSSSILLHLPQDRVALIRK